MNNFNTLDICNNIRMSTEGINALGIPLDVFPQKVQKLILDLSSYENYNVEFTVAAILSAAATAIGNTHRIRIKGYWVCSPALYIMLVGRAGLGKTPPLSFAYRPIREHDERMFLKFKEDMEAYERMTTNPFGRKSNGETDIGSTNRPVLVKTVISDFTTEAMMNVHKNNLRGISVLVDELLALFKSLNRYSNSNPLVEYLLSAYSGEPLDSVRKSEKIPVHIQQPCINLIGSIQTLLLSSVCNREYTANGLLDRFLFVYPKNHSISQWKKESGNPERRNMAECWKEIIDNILAIPNEIDEEHNTVKSVVLDFSDEAREYFFDWNNAIINEVNAIEDDNLVESRKMKLNGNVARISLILQLLKWASGECHKMYVDSDSVMGAVRMIDYFEDCYHRAQEVMATNEIGEVKDLWLDSLPEEFSTAEAVTVGAKWSMARRTVFDSLKKLTAMKNAPIEKMAHGKYRKVRHKSGDALCTSALSGLQISQEQRKEQGKAKEETGQSAIVQSAGETNNTDEKNERT